MGVRPRSGNLCNPLNLHCQSAFGKPNFKWLIGLPARTRASTHTFSAARRMKKLTAAAALLGVGVVVAASTAHQNPLQEQAVFHRPVSSPGTAASQPIALAPRESQPSIPAARLNEVVQQYCQI